MPSHVLEQQAHKLGLRRRKFPREAIGSPQQMQIVGLIIRETKFGWTGFQIKFTMSCPLDIHRIFTEARRSASQEPTMLQLPQTDLGGG
jgi:hypothetical protein